ncbi:MAG: T9SS type A sorting domain-containing protein [Aureispira sp.]
MRYLFYNVLHLLFLIGTCSPTQAQFQIPLDSSFYTLQDSFYHYYQDDSTEGGMYNKMRRATMIWGPRLAPDGRMSRANRAMLQYTRAYMNIPSIGTGGSNTQTSPIVLPNSYPALIQWGELGHLNPLVGGNASYAKGMGQIQRLAFHPSYNGTSNQTIYAGSHYGGLYRTDDGGNQWYNYHTDRGLPMTSVGDIAASSNYVFVCTGNGDHASTHFGAQADYAPIRGNINDFSPIHTQGVYRNTHTNPSSQWVPINGTRVDFLDGTDTTSLLDVFAQGGTMRRIIVHPTNDQILLIATSQGIFRTTNGGSRWQQVLVGPVNNGSITNYLWETAWRGLEFHPTNPNIVYASAKDVYQSIDGGITWSSMTNGLGLQVGAERTNITVTPAAPDRLYAYAVGNSGHVFLYENGVWTAKGTTTNQAKDWVDIAVSPVYQDVVHVTDVTPWHNNDFDNPASNFTAEPRGGFYGGGIHDDLHYLGYPPNGDTLLFAGTHGGVSKSVTSGTGKNAWINLYNGLGLTMIYSFDDWEGDDSLLITANQDIGINHTYNRGQTWNSRALIGDGYGVRINDQTGVSYQRGNRYLGSLLLYPSMQFPAGQGFASNNALIVPRDNYTSNSPIGQAEAEIPNTFPAINHPKNEQFYLGFSELYTRKKDYFAPGDLRYNTGLDTLHVMGPTFNYFGVQIQSGDPNTCTIRGGRPVGTNPVLLQGGSERIDTLCEITATFPDYQQAYQDLWRLNSDLKQLEASTGDRRILEIAFSEDEQSNYTYLVTLGDFSNRRCDLYFNDAATMRCDTCFIKKTANLPIDNTIPNWITQDPNPITGIAVDPLDGNRIWVTFSGYSKQLKVWYSEDAGDSWTNWDDSTNALANLNVPINNIVYQRGTKDRLYIATDVGIYVREGQGAWLRYGESFPNVRVTELKINYCVGKLRAATFGRGLWEANVLPVEKNNAFRSFRTVDTNEIWTADKHLSRDLRVKAGATLHLQNITLNMPKGGLIIIEPGGELLVDSSTITNLCGQTWQGIQVWGNTHLEQIPATNQGVITITNSKIEHAKEAISPWEVGNFPRPDGTGGTGGIVKATNSIFLNNWRTAGFMQYQSPSRQHREVSYFANCTFTVDSNNRQGFLGHISAWDIAGLRVKGCHFEDRRLNKQGNGFGLYALSASFHVEPLRIGVQFPRAQRNSFEGFDRAIEFGNAPTRFSNIVDQCDFDKNRRGVIVRNNAGVKIIRNTFQVGGYSKELPYGLGLLRQGRFIVQQNTYTKSLHAAPRELTIGTWVNDTKAGYNQIRKNTWSGIGIANLVHGDNGDDFNLFDSGLQYFCNENTGNAMDLILNQSLQLTIGTSIADNQGAILQPAKNSFSDPLDNSYVIDYHIYNDGSKLPVVRYWLEPFASNISIPTDTLNVRNIDALNNGDPSFCKEVYLNAFRKRPQVEGEEFDIHDLESRYIYYEKYQQLLAAAQNTSTYDSSEIAMAGQELSYWASEILEYYQNDTLTHSNDSIVAWLERIPGVMAQYELVEHYWQLGAYTNALEKMDHIEEHYDLDNISWSNHRDLRIIKNILVNCYQDNRNEALLTREELNRIKEIANNNYGFAAVYAANIINFFYKYEFEYHPTLPEAIISSKQIKSAEDRINQLAVYPNPSTTWADVWYQLPKGYTNATLEVIGVNGQPIQQILISENNGTINLNTEKWTTGVYFIVLKVGGEMIERTTMVVNH